ncbi:ABC transporter substrate-binding protein [Heliobacterium gestii]|uniref:ABC transporter substrate-binding protein n=2 Tax=Heliomicrobium gestii TaxID=2699 RepID=A0A845L4U9_HELGE|nr:ABC transporter substrate-binding protein [Heliomicrobium gestii]
MAVIFLAISLALAGCASQSANSRKTGDANPTAIRLSEVVHSVFYTPLYVALNLGYFEEEKLKIEMSTAWGGDKAMTALVAEQADIALIGPETIIYTLQQGLDKKILCFAQLTQRDGSFLVGRPGQNFSWDGLKGKTIIGARKGGVPEMVLERVLNEKGLQPFEDVKIIQNIQFTATAGAFQAGTGDYVALFEPTVSELEQAGAGQVVASLGVESGKIPYTVFMASDDYINKNRAAVIAFTKALYRAQQWTASHSIDEITDVILPSFQGSDRAVVRKAVERYHRQESWAVDPQMQLGGLDYLQSIIESAGELKQRIPEERLIRRDIAEEVLRGTLRPQ